ncbi:hypothetical protein DRP05_14835 [Archaeoglobales archaeon]|mgnify:CR=1 FL=1|nr:MAG: hypothetical protein DRP05_14835 [Archaeoglobales archaeon]
MPEQIIKSEHDFGTKKERLSISISPYLKKKLKEMEESGEFANVSEIVNLAIAEFIGKYEAGKLKPRKSTEEIAEEIEQGKHEPVREEDLGEEGIR